MVRDIVSIMGGEYYATDLRATCKTFREAIPPPAKTTAAELLIKSASAGHMAGCIMAKSRGASNLYAMMKAGSKNGRRAVCIQAYLWNDHSYPDYYMMKRACNMGLVEVVSDWLDKNEKLPPSGSIIYDRFCSDNIRYIKGMMRRVAIKYDRANLIRLLLRSDGVVCLEDMYQMAIACGSIECADVIKEITRENSDDVEEIMKMQTKH